MRLLEGGRAAAAQRDVEAVAQRPFGLGDIEVELAHQAVARPGVGDAVTDAAVEIWQASPPADERFPGYGRSATDAEGRFRFVTLKPEAVPGNGNQTQAPHLSVVLLARGLMTALRTRIYFQGETSNETDPLLASIEDPAERATLIAQPAGAGAWNLDIRLQGAGETVFLEV